MRSRVPAFRTRRGVALGAVAVLGLTALAGPAVAPAQSGASVTTLGLSGPIIGTPSTAFSSDGITGEHFSSPAVGDLYGNGEDVVAGFSDGTVHIYPLTANGVGPAIDIVKISTFAIQASPVIVDLNKDGRMDVLVADLGHTVEAFTPSLSNKVIFKVSTGSAAGTYDGNFATPAVADLNKTGTLDVIETSFGKNLWAWSSKANSNGQFPTVPGFPVYLQDTSWSSPVVADLNHSGWPEIIFGYDCDGAPGQRCYPNYGGYVTVIEHNGKVAPGWPRFVPHMTVWSTPAIADINHTGWPDVVVGTGNMPASMYSGKPMNGGHYVYAFQGNNGATLAGFPVAVSGNTTSSPALAHFSHPILFQMAIVTEDGYVNVIDSHGHLLARACANDALANCNGVKKFHESVAIADVDGSGTPYIVVGGEQWLDVFKFEDNNGHFSLVLAYRGWPKDAAHGSVTPHPFTAAPTVANAGGKTWVLLATETTIGTQNAAVLYAFTTGRQGTAAQWSTFKHDSQRTGCTPTCPLP